MPVTTPVAHCRLVRCLAIGSRNVEFLIYPRPTRNQMRQDSSDRDRWPHGLVLDASRRRSAPSNAHLDRMP